MIKRFFDKHFWPKLKMWAAGAGIAIPELILLVVEMFFPDISFGNQRVIVYGFISMALTFWMPNKV